MKFQVSSTRLFNQLQAVSRVIGSKNALPILDDVLFRLEGNQLSLTASDGETTIRTRLEVEEAEGAGMVAFGAKILIETFKQFPEVPLQFKIDEQNFGMTISSPNGEYSVVGVNGAEYPDIPFEAEQDSHMFKMSAGLLLDAISKTIFCTAEDELRPVMNGIYFDMTPEKATLVATDAHRLVRYTNTTVHVDEAASFILPKKPANLLKNVLQKDENDVEIRFGARNVLFTFGNTVIVCRLIDGRYPNYNAVIPQNNTNVMCIDRQTLLSACKRVAVFANTSTALIRLALAENSVTISSQDIDFSTAAEEKLVCSYAGTPMAIGFKAPFLCEILSTLQSEEVQLELADPARAGLILPMENEENEELLMLLMPMLLND
ncbi:MAG: DNA polymerase III subunit beta [Paludibacteraceae bacterium]|jgi:DNA polymerase III, beta subunit|nr:DNA polymerase III subunit beta [Paludibacteraceae bacterium]